MISSFPIQGKWGIRGQGPACRLGKFTAAQIQLLWRRWLAGWGSKFWFAASFVCMKKKKIISFSVVCSVATVELSGAEYGMIIFVSSFLSHKADKRRSRLTRQVIISAPPYQVCTRKERKSKSWGSMPTLWGKLPKCTCLNNEITSVRQSNVNLSPLVLPCSRILLWGGVYCLPCGG